MERMTLKMEEMREEIESVRPAMACSVGRSVFRGQLGCSFGTR